MNSSIKIEKIAEWKGSRLHQDDETGILKVALPGCESFNSKNCIATYAFPNGQRAIDMDFDYLGSFHEGIARVAVKNKGYGYIDKNMNFITPLKYNLAKEFCNGFGLVSVWNKENEKETWLFIDKQGKEHFFDNEYVEVCNNSEGMFRVSTFNLRMNICGYNLLANLAYYSDYDMNAGLWGYTDSNGKEIVKPQYIFAFDFEKNGLALVCKGEWKWTNEWGGGILVDEQKIIFKEGEKFGIMTFEEKVIVKPIYDDLWIEIVLYL